MAEPTSSKETVLKVTNALSIKGVLDPERKVASYLGIQYATIPARFRQSKPKPLVPSSTSPSPTSTQEGTTLDATTYGPRCPQLNPSRQETSHLQAGVPQPPITDDELTCLNLNIDTPHPLPPSPLPVLVYIHGGGFVHGSASPSTTGVPLLHHALSLSKPFIYVSINYRLGLFGFLTSQNLRAEAIASGERPFTNMALYDQRLALLWIQENIHHFGGDPARVTISGESAGAWSVLAHLRSDVPVCRAGIAMSSPNLDWPSWAESEATFDDCVLESGVAPNATATEKLTALRALPANDIVELMDGRLATPPLDPEFFPSHTDTDAKLSPDPIGSPFPFPPWTRHQTLIVGATKHETALFGLQRWKAFTPAEFHAQIPSSFDDPELAEAVAKAYGISPSASQETCQEGFIALTTDAIFGALPASITSSDAQGPQFFTYRFDQADSYPESVFEGYAYHALDCAFLNRLPSVTSTQADKDTRATTDAFSDMILRSVYGEDPWAEAGQRKGGMIFDGSRTRMEDLGRTRWADVMARKDGWEKLGRRSGNRLIGIRHCSLGYGG